MFGPGEREIGMIIRVVSNLVTFVDNSLNQSRIFLSIYSDQEESGLHVRLFQDIENLRRPFRIRTVIERNRDLMLAARALMIQRRELWKVRVFRGEITF